MARVALLSILVALLCAAPASAAVAPHGDEIPPYADTALADAAGPVTTSLASGTWCGGQTSVDDVAHQVAAGNAIKVVYAHAADQSDQFSDYANVIQSDIKAVADAFLTASDAVKTVRFDLGTSCGPKYVDIQSVTLPRTRAQYMGMGFNTRVNTLTADLKPLVAGDPWCPADSFATYTCTRDFLVYADGFYAGDGTTGVATRRTDATPGADNVSNLGGLFAYVLGDGSAGFGYRNSSATTAEHELLHNLGAVQDTSLHSTLGGHCFDEIDVMCYPDGGQFGHTFLSQADMITNCPDNDPARIDCGHDDYFNPAGPVLNTSQTPMWNVYDSDFLCAAASCGSGGPSIASVPTGSGTTTSVTPAAPVPAPAPVRPAAPVTPADPLAGLQKAWQTQIRKLLAGRPLRVTYRPARNGTLTVRLTLGSRAVATASARARAGRRVAVTLRLSRSARRRLAPVRSRLKLRLAFVQ